MRGASQPAAGPDLDTGRLQAFLDELVAAGELTAVTALVGTAGPGGLPDGGTLWTGSAGQARPGVPAGFGTIYDYGSLTKPFAATLALVLDAAGRLPLSLPVGEAFPGMPDRRLARRRLEDLLRHRAGMAAWAPLYVRCRSLAEVLDLLLGGELPRSRPGTYSDLDFLLWGLAAERLLGRPLAALLAESVLGPLGLSSVAPSPGDRPGMAEHRMGTGMEVQLAREAGMEIADLGPPPIGQPQDGNARFLIPAMAGSAPAVMPGASPAPASTPACGHAGLFGTAGDLLRLGQEWLRPGRLLKPEAVAAALGGGGRFALGWWRRGREEGGGGAALSPGAFGHTGFPGGNLWNDPRSGLVLVLIGHRTDPLASFNPRRRAFHTLVYDGRGRRPSRPLHPDNAPERRPLR